MIYEPVKYLYKAVVAKLVSLGYKVDGVNNYPRVEVHSFDKTPTTEKNATSWDITFIIDVITNDSSPGPSFDIIENILNNFSESITITNFRCVIWDWELLTPVEEVNEADFNIWRQIQRVRVRLEGK